MISGEEYLERIRRLKDNVQMGGQKVRRDDPRLIPGVRVVQLTYELAAKKEYQNLFTISSHLGEKTINRFTHIHQSPEDLLLKQEMTRVGVQKTGFCIQRCMGIDCMNALSVVTKEMDEELKTDYHDRFLACLKYWQEKDVAGCCAQTDSKGHRKLRPHQQQDKDQYLRIVKRRKDGIVIRGAKVHITMAGRGSFSDSDTRINT